MGPVSVEVPIDIQQAEVSWPDDFSPLAVELVEPDITELDALAETLAGCHRPLLWLGGGARSAAEAVGRLAEMGVWSGDKCARTGSPSRESSGHFGCIQSL